MPFNGSGVFQRVRNWVADAAAGIKIRADYHDAEDDGFAAGLTNCITKDGQTIVTQNIPWNSKRITGLEDPVNAQDASTKAYADTKMAGAGGTMTGDLTIKKDGPQIFLDDTDNSVMAIQGLRNGKQRWWLRVGNGEAETGANAGSNFDLHRYADDGAYLGHALMFNRATGLGTITGDPAVALGIATKNYVDNLHNTQQAAIDAKQPNLGFTPVQQAGGSGMMGNKVYIGWNNSQLLAQVDGLPLGAFFFGTPPATGITNIRWLHAGASYPPGTSSGVWQDPFPNSVIYLYVTSGGTVISGFQHKYLQVATTGGFFTVGS
jgi:hypothetical protein